MTPNQNFDGNAGPSFRRGHARPDPETTNVEDPEVLPPMAPAQPRGGADVCVGPVRFDRNTTLNSPAFWLLTGLAGGIGLMVWLDSRKR